MEDRFFEDCSKKNNSPDEPIWLCDPPLLDEFFESPDYMGGPKLSAIQREDAIALLGANPKKIFSGGSNYNIGVLLWGKGSGKDWFCAGIQSYLLEVLRCMKNPHAFFKLAPNEPIDALNVSLSQHHAINIYFLKLKNAVLSNKKMRERYSIYQGNQLMRLEGNVEGRPRMELKSGEIILKDLNIRAVAFGCDHESAEGGNPIFWSMDEASAFKDHTTIANAKKIYSTLRTSAVSRFGMKFKGMVISYPRSEDDFTMRMWTESKRTDKTEHGDTIYGSRHATWEVRPTGTFSFETFHFEGTDIPVDFQDDFEKYPEESKGKFLCRPPAVENAFICYRHRIDECVVPGKAPLITVQTDVIEHLMGEDRPSDVKRYIGKVLDPIAGMPMDARRIPRVIHVDGGLVTDSAVLILAHGVHTEVKLRVASGKTSPTYVNKVVVDAVLLWKPDKKKGLQVSLNNVEAIIIELKARLNIVRVSYDQWNSQSSLETLQAHGIRAEQHTINTQDYCELRSMIYSGSVELLPQRYTIGDIEFQNSEALLLAEELKRLMLINGKVDHPKDFSKDAADCLAGVNRLLNHPDEKRQTMQVVPSGILAQGVNAGARVPLSLSNMGLSVGDSYQERLRYSSLGSGFRPTPRRQSGMFPSGIISPYRGFGNPGSQGGSRKDIPPHLLR